MSAPLHIHLSNALLGRFALLVWVPWNSWEIARFIVGMQGRALSLNTIMLFGTCYFGRAGGGGVDVVRQLHFPGRVPRAKGRWPGLLVKDWEGGNDPYVFSAGSSSSVIPKEEATAPEGLLVGLLLVGSSYQPV